MLFFKLKDPSKLNVFVDSDDLEELEPVTYSREELLTLANSPLSRKRPTESSYLCKLYPEVCLEKVCENTYTTNYLCAYMHLCS